MDRASRRATRACSIGAGRMGRALLAAAGRAGMDVVGAWSRSTAGSMSSVTDGCDVVFVAVPDDAVAGVVDRLADLHRVRGDRPLVLVASGGVELAALDRAHRATLRVARLHPLQVVTEHAPERVLDEVTCAITAFDADDRVAARDVARALGMRPVDLADEDAATWHAAAVLSSNALTAILADAIALVHATGVDAGAARDACTRLATAAIAQVREHGAGAALTGPIARGDEGTVAAHRRALATRSPELLAAYDVLAERTRALARQEAPA